MPEIFHNLIEEETIIRVTADAIVLIGAITVEELLIKTPENTLVEEGMGETHKVTLNVEFGGESWLGIIISGLTDVVEETFLGIECAFTFAAGVGVR